jgi:hypothetical protein
VATSGLFLREVSETVAAREGALGGAKGGRHGKDHRGRGKRKRRDHGEKKDKGEDDRLPGRGLFEFRKTALGVGGAGALFTFTFFYRQKTGLDEYGPWILARSETPTGGAGYRYAPDRYRVGVLVSAPAEVGPGQVFVDLRNMSFDFPRGSVYVGAGLDPVHNSLGQTLVNERVFGVPHTGEGSSVTRVYNVGENRPARFSLYREFDSDDFIEFFFQVAV